MAKLYGVDVFSGEGEHILDKISYDFAIIKVSGNPKKYDWDYVNPYAKSQIKDCIEHKKLLGLYHFTWGKKDPCIEADFFIKQVKKLGYLGKAMLVIDYEADAVERGRSWVKKFAERITELAGYKPVLYSFSSCINEQKLGSLGYPIWCANYYKGYEDIYGYDTSGCKIGYKDSIMWQFTSSGHLKGYKGDLDLNVFYGDKDDFKKYMGANKVTPEPAKKTVSDIAAEVIKGKWGNGAERKKKLTEAGYDYKKVQAKVDDILLTKVAKAVIAGKYGNGEERKKKLKKAGYDPVIVQAKVNKILKG
jgi:hypothetical protein